MNMKKWIFALMLLALVLAAGCAAEPTPYARNDAEGYTVTVCFDANGGTFTTNTAIITDSFNLSQLPVNSQGQVALPLIAPDDAARGKNAFAPVKAGCFLAGWYAQRTGTEDAWSYAQPWDFATDRCTLDPNGAYTSETPVLTLYAAWVPLYEIECYDLATGQLLDTLRYDPAEGERLLPKWDEATGAINMNRFPQRAGYTFNGAYFDAQGTQPVTTDSIPHSARLDAATATVTGGTMRLYVDWLEGEWYHIYTAQQFLDNASVGGSYMIHADLDFQGLTWPTSLMHGSYTGTLEGNGHTLRNISFAQTNNSKTNGGLFGYLTETAALRDVTFENVSFTIQNGTRMAGTSYGLLAGTVAETAKLESVQILSSALLIDSGCYFGTEDYTIGLVCGMGATAIDPAGITCQAVGEAPETVIITVTDSVVTLEFAAE